MSSAEDVSITATEATVAGSSVAATEAEEDAASFTGATPPSTGEKVLLTKDSSLDISIGAPDDKVDDDDGEDNGEYAAPMHLHALRTPAKLKGARSRSSSRSRPGSRRNSMSPIRGKGGELIGGTISPSASVESSLDGISADHLSVASHGSDLDPDILLDKLGFRDLDPDATQEEMQEMLRKHISSNNSGLATLNERMSEETMDDVHAFQDLVPRSKSASGAMLSPTKGSDIDEGDEDESGDDSSPDKTRRDALRASRNGLSSSAVMGSTTYLLGPLCEGDEAEGDSELVLEIPEGIHPGEEGDKRKKNRDTMMAVAGSFDDSDEDDDDGDDAAAVGPGSSIGDDLTSEEGGDVVLEIPEGITPGEEGGRRKKNRDTTMAVAGSFDSEGEDDDAAAVGPGSSIGDDLTSEGEGGDVVLEIPEGVISQSKRKKNRGTMNTTMAIAGMQIGSDDEDDDDDDAVGCMGSICDDITDASDDADAEAHGEGEDILVEIPDGIVSLGGESKHNRNNTMCSTMAVASLKSLAIDDDDDDDADVEVPTAVLEELKITEAKRKLLHRNTSMAVMQGEMDYLEADEQDGLEADLASDDEGNSR